jgi:2,4-dienoyl-CoA reductase (NADPH2)
VKLATISPMTTFIDTLELREKIDRLGLAIPLSELLAVLARPVGIGPLVAPNALAIHPMEGCDGLPTGEPGELTIRRYDRFARGGAGLIWAEAIAVLPEARANPLQLWLHEKTQPAFAALADRIFAQAQSHRNHRPFLAAQLTHSGRYSRPVDKPARLITQHCPQRDAAANVPADHPLVDDDYLDRLPEVFAAAARLAYAAGFDAVDIKACHGYLLSELLGAATRPGKYGGSFENRTRLFLDIVDAVNAVRPADKLVVTRMNVFDHIARPYGWGTGDSDDVIDLSEVFALVDLLSQRDVAMINVTAGNPYFNPFCNRPFDIPATGAAPSPEDPIVGVGRLLGLCGQLQGHAPHIPMVATGTTWLRAALPFVAAGLVETGMARFVGVGRLAFAYPDFAADILDKGQLDLRKVCIACSKCTQIMRDHGSAGCVIRDAEVYGPIYRAGREKAH